MNPKGPDGVTGHGAGEQFGGLCSVTPSACIGGGVVTHSDGYGSSSTGSGGSGVVA
jgi:hypothetical protein